MSKQQKWVKPNPAHVGKRLTVQLEDGATMTTKVYSEEGRYQTFGETPIIKILETK